MLRKSLWSSSWCCMLMISGESMDRGYQARQRQRAGLLLALALGNAFQSMQISGSMSQIDWLPVQI